MTPDDIREFLDALDLHGGRLESWPPEARASAEALLSMSAEARAHLAAMRRAEKALAATTAQATSANGFAAYAMTRAQEHRPQIMARRLSWAVAGALALVAGVYVGAGPAPRVTDNPSEIVASALDQSGEHDVW